MNISAFVTGLLPRGAGTGDARPAAGEHDALVEASDRRAAEAIEQFAAEIDRAVEAKEAVSRFLKANSFNARENGALATAVFARFHAPEWAMALGLQDRKPKPGRYHIEQTAWRELLKRLLRRECDLSPAQHRVLLKGIAQQHPWLVPDIAPVSDLVVAWAQAHPEANREELRELFRAAGGHGSCSELALKLKPLMRYRPAGGAPFAPAPEPRPEAADKERVVRDYAKELKSQVEARQEAWDAAVAKGRRNPQENPWSALVTEDDRRAARAIEKMVRERDFIREDPSHAEYKGSAEYNGAFAVALFAMIAHPGWAAAIGVSDRAWETFSEWGIRRNIDDLLNRKATITATQHRILLQALTYALWDDQIGIAALDDLAVAWIDQHPGVNDKELRELFAAAGCRGDLGDLHAKLLTRGPKPLRTLTEAALVLILESEMVTGARALPRLRLTPNHYDLDGGETFDNSIRSAFQLGAMGERDYKTELTLLDRDLPTLGELAWLVGVAEQLPVHGISASFVRLLLVAALRKRIASSERLYEALASLAQKYQRWGVGRLVKSARALLAQEERLLEQWGDDGKAALALLDKAGGVAPTANWLKELSALVGPGRRGELGEFIQAALDAAYVSRRDPVGFEARINGFIWAARLCEPARVGPALTHFAWSFCYASEPGVGMRDEALGNACLRALGEMPGAVAAPWLSRLLARVKYPKTRKLIESALDKVAGKAEMTRAELDELTLPSHHLSAAGTLEMAVGGGAALIAIDGATSVAMQWRTPEGKVVKAVPAAMKEAKADIKAAQATRKEIEADLAVQPWRLQRLWLEERRWTSEDWRSRYVEHPLVGELSRRLIWNAEIEGRRLSGLWRDGELVGSDGRAVNLAGARISLWHPVGCEVGEVLAWRARLAQLGVVQPFKQAHREVYLVTDAERRTGVYSNRFAGHIVKQQQMLALARLSGWAMTPHVGYDGGFGKYPARIALPQAGLVAEYWVEGVGDDEFTGNGAYLYLSTDQLRLIRPDDMKKAVAALGSMNDIKGEAIRIEDAPPRLLSEIMRSCDLFVGVASIANDPAWIDAGGDVRNGRWRRQADAYWRARSFGEVGATGETRRELLAALLPSLVLGKVSRVDGNFLRVKGTLREYKIHLGSGNILMEPNDEYLCIVPAPAARPESAPVALPFEGDDMLAIILSKAALLAADDRIVDSTILSQIRPPA